MFLSKFWDRRSEPGAGGPEDECRAFSGRRDEDHRAYVRAYAGDERASDQSDVSDSAVPQTKNVISEARVADRLGRVTPGCRKGVNSAERFDGSQAGFPRGHNV